jgi:hypothetical protein
LLCRVAAIFIGRRVAEQSIDECFDLIRPGLCSRYWCCSRGRHGGIFGFLDDVREDEAVAVARDGANEVRLARIVAKRPPQRADRLRQRAIRHDDVGPDALEDLVAADRRWPALDQQHQQIDIAGNERQAAAVLEQLTPAHGQDEVAEPIPIG